MTSNSGGSTWVERGDVDFINKTYDSKDGKYLAIQNKVENTLTFITMKHLKKTLEAKATEEKKNLDGF